MRAVNIVQCNSFLPFLISSSHSITPHLINPVFLKKLKFPPPRPPPLLLSFFQLSSPTLPLTLIPLPPLFPPSPCPPPVSPGGRALPYYHLPAQHAHSLVSTHSPTDLQLGKDTFQSRIHQYLCFRHQITKVPRTV